MPETCLPIRTRPRVPIASPALAAAFDKLTLGGCSGGDFGRTRQDVRNDDMHRWIGAEATSASACIHRISSSPTTSGCFAILPTP